jgi:hypothetical protein
MIIMHTARPRDCRQMPWRPVVFIAVVLVLSIALGGCSLMFAHQHDIDHPANPLSDDQAEAQVVDAAKQIAQLVSLPDMYGGFAFESCNDQGDPPYRGVVEMSFKLPIATISQPSSIW